LSADSETCERVNMAVRAGVKDVHVRVKRSKWQNWSGKYIKGLHVVLLTMFMKLRLLQINSKCLLLHISVYLKA